MDLNNAVNMNNELHNCGCIGNQYCESNIKKPQDCLKYPYLFEQIPMLYKIFVRYYPDDAYRHQLDSIYSGQKLTFSLQKRDDENYLTNTRILFKIFNIAHGNGNLYRCMLVIIIYNYVLINITISENNQRLTFINTLIRKINEHICDKNYFEKIDDIMEIFNVRFCPLSVYRTIIIHKFKLHDRLFEYKEIVGKKHKHKHKCKYDHRMKKNKLEMK